MRDLLLRLVAVQQMHFLGAGEDAAVVAGGRTGGGGLRVGDGIIDLEAVAAVFEPVMPAGAHGHSLVGDHGGQPVFVGEAGPAARAGMLVAGAIVLVGLGLHLGVGEVLQRSAGHADQPFEQHAVAGGLRQVVAAHALPWIDVPRPRCRCCARSGARRTCNCRRSASTIWKVSPAPLSQDRVTGWPTDTLPPLLAHSVSSPGILDAVRPAPAELHVAWLRVVCRLEHAHQRRGLGHRLAVIASGAGRRAGRRPG